jgi:hypothetical protein
MFSDHPEMRPVPGQDVAGGLAIVRMGESGIDYVPRFTVTGLGSTLVPFDEWWRASATFPQHAAPPSRRNIVLWLANKDGGSHADAVLPTPYVGLRSGADVGWVFTVKGQTVELSPVLAIMREIAEEVRVAFRAVSAIQP